MAACLFGLCLAGLLAAAPAWAAATDWQEDEGASIRLLTAGHASAGGVIKGALDIELKPGWKTYWRDPGTGGVPPQIDISASTNLSGAEFQFPLPERHDDGYGAWAGYKAPVALPLFFRLADGAAPALIEADVFLGICKDICVPVSLHLSLDPNAGDDPDDAAEVDAAFASLPKPAGDAFGVTAEAVAGETLELAARVPAGATGEPTLFLAGENGFSFGVPVPDGRGGAWNFRVPVLAAPDRSEGQKVFYTLSSGNGAVSGTFPYP